MREKVEMDNLRRALSFNFKKTMAVCLGMLVIAAAGYSQHHHSPYAGWQERVIKSLSPDQIKEYLEGKGMGLALAAELNHYPGPAHVLELASELKLDQDQRLEMRSIFDKIHKQAVDIGKDIVDLERQLDEKFRKRSILKY